MVSSLGPRPSAAAERRVYAALVHAGDTIGLSEHRPHQHLEHAMGSLGALAFAGLVADGTTSIDSALHWHLSSNHYPAVPVAFVETCRDAIDACNEGDWDRDVPLPKGCSTHGILLSHSATACPTSPDCVVEAVITWNDDREVATASALVESFHLGSFVDY
jgi:hypothetical protein